MTQHEVVVAGAGPTGLMLAGELALAGVDVAVVERRHDQHVDGSRAGGLHARTLEVLDQRGILDRFLAAGETMQVQGFGGIPLDISDFPTRHPHGLALWQSRFEPLLAEWVEELGVPILRGRELVGVRQDADGVDATLADGDTVRGRYLVGCDGGRSVVRKQAGIAFEGAEPTTSWMVAEVDMDGEPELGFRHDDAGTHALGRRADRDGVGVVVTERSLVRGDNPTLEQLRAALVGIYGTDFGLRRARWLSRFTDMTRQAAEYRRGRLLLAGDAAHVHPPQGGQGLNTGVQDAVNLGWKLAQVVRGRSPETLLDTYHAERHPVGAQVLRTTMAQVALGRPGERHQALRDTMAELLALDEPRRHLAGRMSGLDLRYDLGDRHPLVGRRMPDLELHTADGPTRVSALLHRPRHVLLGLDPAAATDRPDLSPWTDHLACVDARAEGPVVLPVTGEVAAPPAMLVRPDGHVAWAGDPADPGLLQALTRWCGAPTSVPATMNGAIR